MHHPQSRNAKSSGRDINDTVFTLDRGEHRVDIQAGRGSSQERIMDEGSSRTSPSDDIDLDVMGMKRGGINKTVEFEVYGTRIISTPDR